MESVLLKFVISKAIGVITSILLEVYTDDKDELFHRNQLDLALQYLKILNSSAKPDPGFIRMALCTLEAACNNPNYVDNYLIITIIKLHNFLKDDYSIIHFWAMKINYTVSYLGEDLKGDISETDYEYLMSKHNSYVNEMSQEKAEMEMDMEFRAYMDRVMG